MRTFTYLANTLIIYIINVIKRLKTIRLNYFLAFFTNKSSVTQVKRTP